MDWKDNLIEDTDRARAALLGSKRLAILGIKPDDQSGQPAFYVSKYLKSAGYDVVPVPVYYPECTEILGTPVQRNLREVGPVDMIIVFRRPRDIDQHVEDILAVKPSYVWFQQGIRNEGAAERFAKAGIGVIQDRCSMVEHRMAARS